VPPAISHFLGFASFFYEFHKHKIKISSGKKKTLGRGKMLNGAKSRINE
jgi:hypothetical protein